MFKSARFKLTLFYLAGILLVSLSFSVTTRWYAQREFSRSNVEQRGEFRSVIERALGYQLFRPNDDVFGFQRAHEQEIQNRLNNYVLIINLGALVIGGLASYWFAGRTLRPIEEAHEAQKRFASDASHELRTPLTIMKTENEVFLRQKSFTEAEARELISSNLEELDRLERLSTSLLALTQYEDTAVQLKTLHVTRVVDDAVKSAKKTAPMLDVQIKVAPGKISGNKESLERLLGILLDNAAKYGPSDQTVLIEGKKSGDRYILLVRDHGPGVAAEDLPHIFERLYRGDKARSSNIPGHGLGLTLAQRIATVNKVQLSASNSPKGGAIFSMELRLAN